MSPSKPAMRATRFFVFVFFFFFFFPRRGIILPLIIKKKNHGPFPREKGNKTLPAKNVLPPPSPPRCPAGTALGGRRPPPPPPRFRQKIRGNAPVPALTQSAPSFLFFFFFFFFFVRKKRWVFSPPAFRPRGSKAGKNPLPQK